VAKAIATVGGTALVPGVSKNRRLYSREIIAGAVARAQERIGGDGLPLTMLTHHGAEDSSDRIVGRITSMTLAEDGSARFTADIADTPHGRTIASLVDTSDGKPAFLSGVSIRGAWAGRVRKENGPDGKPVETGDGLSLAGLDYTASPGVAGAAVDTFAWASGGQQETSEQVLITESVEARVVTISEETAPAEAAPAVPAVPEAVAEALQAVFAPAEVHVLEDGLCATCGDVTEAKRKPGTAPYGDVPYADPGYLDDDGNQAAKSGKPGIKRYPLDKKHIRAAWSYINQGRNARQYTAAQLKRIKGRIKAAMRSIGAKVTAESDVVAGFVIGEAVEAPAQVLEWLGSDPSRSGSWSVSASNGPVNLNLSSYCMDPADLDVILRAAADAACKALAALDPDMDGDVDVPGAKGGDTDSDGGHESAPDDPASQTAEAHEGTGEPAEVRETPTGTEAPVTTEATTNPGGSAPSPVTQADLDKAVAEAAKAGAAAALEADRKARKAAKKAARKAAETASPAAPVAEGQDERDKKLIAEALKAAGVTPPEEVTEEQAREAEVTKRVQETVQGLVAAGAILPGRSGLVVREHATDPEQAPSAADLAKMPDDDFGDFAGRNLDKYVGDNTRIQALHT
jgi:Family of unknown function (DUF6582)